MSRFPLPPRFTKSWLSILCIGCSLPLHQVQAVQATPSSYQGFGTATPGGSRGAVYRVTTLNDEGPGSLRDAVSGSHRYIVFDVAGEILPKKAIEVKGSFLTIDGTTAPSPGIVLRGRGLEIHGTRGAHDVIVQGLRIRNAGGDGIQIAWDAHNIVVDRVSVDGSTDGNVDITHGAHDVTVQWSILGTTRLDKNMLLKTQKPIPEVPAETNRVTLHHNIFTDSAGRNPLISNVYTGFYLATDTTADLRNNVIANWDTGMGTAVECGAQANIVNNIYSSPHSPRADQEQALLIRPAVPGPAEQKFTCHDSVPNGPSHSGWAYVNGNVNHLNEPVTVNADRKWSDPSKQVATPFPAAPVTTTDACTAAQQVMENAGVRPLDAIDFELLSGIDLTGCGVDGPPPDTPPDDSPSDGEDTPNDGDLPPAGTLTFSITSGNSDAEQREGKKPVLTSSDLVVGKLRTVGLQFSNVVIPQGAFIESAVLKMYATGKHRNSVSTRYSGERASHSAPFGGFREEFTQRPKTDAFVDDTPIEWMVKGFNDSPDLSAIVQEIVDQPGWVPGNTLTVFIADKGSDSVRNISSFEAGPAQAAVLVVTYRSVL